MRFSNFGMLRTIEFIATFKLSLRAINLSGLRTRTILSTLKKDSFYDVK